MHLKECDLRFLTKEELAIQLKVSVATINYWIGKGKLHPIKSGKKCLFPVEIVDELLGLNTVS